MVLRRHLSGRDHHPMSSTPLPSVVKPLMSQKVQKTAQSPTLAPLEQKTPSMVFRQPSSTQGKVSNSSEAIPNQWSSIEDLLPDRLSGSSQMAHALDSNKSSLNQNLATEPNNSHHQRLASSHSQPSSQALNPIELEILAEEIYHQLRQRLEIDRERHGFSSGRLPW